MLAPLDEAALKAGELELAEITAIAGSWCPAGTALYVYRRACSGTTTTVSADSALLNKMLEERREHEVRASATGGATDGEMERGLLRTALMNAAMTEAMEKGSVSRQLFG